MKLHSGRRGFTLIEILVVIAIIAILVAILVPAIVSGRRKARTEVTKARFARIEAACEDYLTEYGHYPPAGDMVDLLTKSEKETQSNAFSANKPKVHGDLGDMLSDDGNDFLDGWDNKIIITVVGSASSGTQRVKLLSKGPDGMTGSGDEADDDVKNYKD